MMKAIFFQTKTPMLYVNIFYRDNSNEIALRNEEINRQRLQSSRASAGGPLKVTDPTAFAALLADMKLKAEQQKKLEDDREAERAKREGASYKSPEERAKESKESKAQFRAGEEARSIDDGKFDPKKDYYAILGVERAASAAEIRQKYKRLALLYHPDKHKSETPEEQAAVEASFRQVAAAFDLLLDEEQRALYDKCRDYMDANPGKGLPPLSPEEAAKMASGAAELRKMRRLGPKLAKHNSLNRDIEISLPKLNFGCTRAVAVERRRVDYSGKEHLSTKTFHLVIRKGSREGDKLTFSDEGDETVDTHPGDLIFTLRAKPHPVFRRRGEKDLEIFAAAVPAEDIIYAAEIETLSGGKRVVLVPALRAALENGGMGGIWHAVLPKLGLFDGKEPWEAVILKDKIITTNLKPGPVYLLGSSNEIVPASLLAGMVAPGLKHKLEALEMMNDSRKIETSSNVSGAGPRAGVVCINFQISDSNGEKSTNQNELSAASTALLDVLEKQVPGLVSTAAISIISGNGGGEGNCKDEEPSSFIVLEDTVWTALHTAELIILDLYIPTKGSSSAEKEAQNKEKSIACARQCLKNSGILDALWGRHWSGVPIIAIGDGCSILGTFGNERKYHSVLPWYAVRAGGGSTAGWQNVCLAAESDKTTAVGVLETSAYVVDSIHGGAELVVAPCKEALVGRAGWGGPAGAVASVIEEAEEDFGYFAAFCSNDR